MVELLEVILTVSDSVCCPVGCGNEPATADECFLNVLNLSNVSDCKGANRMHFKSGDETWKVIYRTFSLTNQICLTVYLLPKLVEGKLRKAIIAAAIVYNA